MTDTHVFGTQVTGKENKYQLSSRSAEVRMPGIHVWKSFRKSVWRRNVISLQFCLLIVSQPWDTNLLKKKSVNKTFSYITAEILIPISHPWQGRRQPLSICFSKGEVVIFFSICCCYHDSISKKETGFELLTYKIGSH